MKKIIPIAILFLAFFFIKAKADVFCEEMTATTCKACPDVAEILHEIYESKQYPFYYVAMVVDKNDLAMEKANEYNVYGYPTCFFDGGYEVIMGKQAKENFENAIEKCLQREKILEGSLKVKWLGNNNIEIELNIKNNGQRYEGTLKVYVVEPVSRWKDYNGKPYHFGFLDYAINENIVIEGGEELKRTIVWNGTAEGYEISKDNVMAIAVVFSKEGETRYSDPPQNTRPFTAHFVDFCKGAYPMEDSPPTIEFIKKPSATHGYSNVTFEWKGNDDHGSVLYSYKLAGYEDWHDWSNVTKASYENLSDGNYEFILRGKDNVGQITEISWKFVIDTSPPEVIDYYPENNAKNVPVDVAIRIKFSHEMNKDFVENGLKVEPKFSYEVQWKNSNEIIIYPLQLNYKTIYTITIKDACRKSGQKLPEFSFSFETAPKDTLPPSILEAKPNEAELYDDFKIIFSEPMDKFVGNSIQIEPWLPFKYKWEKNDTLLLIHFKEFIPGNYTVVIYRYLTDKSGNPLDKNYTFSFKITKPRVIYSSIGNREINVPLNTSIEIRFSVEMNKTSVKNALRIVPDCQYEMKWQDNKTIIINLSLKAGTKYMLQITKDAQDIRKLSMEKNFTINFSTFKIFEREEEIEETPSFTILLAVTALLIALRKRKLK